MSGSGGRGRAVIGCTGFVGGNLARQAPFDVGVHATDVDVLRGGHFEEVWCAGAPGVKWLANREPERDRESLRRLMDVLGSVRVARFVLISTVDVFAEPVDVWEDSPTPCQGLQPYGLHRLQLEAFVRKRFADSLVIRLPGLFGPHLRKNAIFDLARGERLEALHPDSSFQFYDLRRLSADVERARSLGLHLLHLATEPLCLGEVAPVFGRTLTSYPTTPPARYDVRSRHAEAWGASARYMYDREQVLADLQQFARDCAREEEHANRAEGSRTTP